jgi:hypothetical protein
VTLQVWITLQGLTTFRARIGSVVLKNCEWIRKTDRDHVCDPWETRTTTVAQKDRNKTRAIMSCVVNSDLRWSSLKSNAGKYFKCDFKVKIIGKCHWYRVTVETIFNRSRLLLVDRRYRLIINACVGGIRLQGYRFIKCASATNRWAKPLVPAVQRW